MSGITETQALTSQEKLQEEIVDPKEIRSRIWTISWPVIAEMSLGTITQIVDMAMVGRTDAGSASIAAVGLSMQPFMVAQSVFAAISVGTTALVARFIGAKQERSASDVMRNSLIIAMLLAGLMGVLGFVFARPIIVFMGAQENVVDLGVAYVRYLMPGLALMLAAMMLTGALRGAGDTKTPMKVNILINIFNPILNYVLIFGKFGFPEMGIRGAALATTISRGLGAVILVYLCLAGRAGIKLYTENFWKLDVELIKRVLKVGVPAAAEQLVMRLGQMSYVKIVAGLGMTMYAAHTIAINAESISYMPGWGFATAATALVGQNLGAKRPRAASRSGFEAWKLGCAIMGFMGVVMFVVPHWLMRIYTDEVEVINYGVTCLRIIALAQIPMASSFILGGALRGAGDTRFMMYVSGGAVWLVRFTLALLFVKVLGWGLLGAWLAMAMDWVARSLAAGLRFKGGKWKEIEV